MTNMINNTGKAMVEKARLVNEILRERLEGTVLGPLHNEPRYSELKGMTQLLKAMEIEYSIQLSDYGIIESITIMGKVFKV